MPDVATTAWVLNVTATGSTGPVYPDGGSPDNSSSVNYLGGQTVPNMVFAPIGADGGINIYNGGGTPADVIVDQSGYYYRDPGN